MLATPTFHAFKETLENNAERRRLYVSRLQGAAVQGMEDADCSGRDRRRVLEATRDRTQTTQHILNPQC